ncbi:cytochrome P450 [Nocardia transvalensis]|uniref:cytochrome P450 n=1 Tax=Nocardia transvalensis TaxID=37333 RepID=UPI0018946290|nr:cytochrome P450 [Nocardia transvalensis]MBF6329822.1 cytochrome P450 [Nocardia transvalensis]
MSTTSIPDPPPPIDIPLAPPGAMGPPEQYAQLRRECPFARLQTMLGRTDVTMCYVTRYSDVKELIADPRLIRPSINAWPPQTTQPADTGPGLITVMEMEGPQHVALRRALADALSARSIRRYLPRLRQLATDMLEDFAADGPPGDLIAGFAEPFPLLVMCDLVGIPYTEREYFLPMADAALGALQTLDEGRQVTGQLRAFISSVIDRKRHEPDQDILTHLIRVCDDGGVLTEESVISFGLSMLVAGYRTTTMFLANSVLTLLTQTGQYARLRDNREIMPTAVEELLRYIPVMNGVVVLLATEDIQLHGHTIGKGEAVLPVLAAANRDETVFTDPDQLDLERMINPHIVFGRGAHNCLGVHLARAEMTVALDTILDRFPQLHLLDDQPPTWDDTSLAKSPVTLPVGW